MSKFAYQITKVWKIMCLYMYTKPVIMKCIFTGDGAGVGKGRTVAGKLSYFFFIKKYLLVNGSGQLWAACYEQMSGCVSE